MKKRILPLLLCIVMLISCIAVFPASAEGEESANTGTTSGETANTDGSITIKEGFTIPKDDAAKYGDAEEYPWAVFQKSGETYTFKGAYKLFSGPENNFLRTSDHQQWKEFTSAMGKAFNLVSATTEAYILLRGDYTIRTKDNPAIYDGDNMLHYNATTSDAGYWDADANGGKGAYVDTVPTESYGENQTCYKYNRAWDKRFDNMSTKEGKMTIDLAGHTFNTGSAKVMSLQNKVNNEDLTKEVNFNLNLINGNITNIKTFFDSVATNTNYRYVLSTNETDKRQFNFTATFENTTLGFASGASALINHNVSNAATYIPINIDVNFVGSTVHIGDTLNSNSNYKLFNLASPSGSLDVSFDAESKIGTREVLESNVKYDGTKLLSTSDDTRSSITAEIEYLNPVDSKYGKIPYQYADENEYPFAVFIDEKFNSAYKYWSGDNAVSGQYLHLTSGLWSNASSQSEKTVNVLLRRDYIADTIDSDGDGIMDSVFYNFSHLKMKALNIDLGGHTFDAGSRDFLNYQIKSDANTTWVMTTTVFNGTVKSNKSIINILINKNGKFDAGNSFVFDNVTFKDVQSNVVTAADALKTITGIESNANGKYPIEVTIKNTCTWENTKKPYASWIDTSEFTGDIAINVNCEHKDNTDKICAFCGYTDTVVLKEYNTTLGTTLGFNFKAFLPKNVTKAVITVDGVMTEVPVSSITYGQTNVFTAPVSSIQVRKEITIQFYAGDEIVKFVTVTDAEEKTEYKSSVFEYAVKLLNDSDEKVVGAAKALLTYAAYAEVYFADKSDATEGAVNEAYNEYITSLEAAATDKVVSGTGAGAYLGKVYLNLDNATEIKIALNDAESAVLTNNGENIEIAGAYIIISDIDARNLGTDYSFTINGVDVQISALAVAKVVMESDAYNANFKNLMKALCLYAEASAKLGA